MDHMSVGTAWAILGFDPKSVLTRLLSLPKKQRLEAATKELSKAKEAAKSLRYLHHPDRNGDPEKFRLVGEALASLEHHTQEFARKMVDAEREEQEKASKRPFIQMDR